MKSIIAPLRNNRVAPLLLVLAILQLSFFFSHLNGGAALAAQNSSSQSGAQPARKTSSPYKGDLEIFERKDRDEKLQVQRVMDVLGIRPGANVADIGAGSGWFSVRAAKRAAPGGVVYAVDINPESISYIDNRTHRENIPNIKTVLGTADDPKLPENSVDAVLILKTYHEIAHPVLLLRNLKKSLRSGARIGIIDRNGNGEDHGISRDVVIQEASQAGYRMVEQYDFVKGDAEDYFLVFRPNENSK